MKGLRAMLKLLKDAPARRDIYAQQILSTEFPQKVCLILWTKNEEVAAKALLTWDNVCIVIKYYCSLLKSSRPQNNVSYDTLVPCKDDSS